jgi:hypothetical protein
MSQFKSKSQVSDTPKLAKAEVLPPDSFGLFLPSVSQNRFGLEKVEVWEQDSFGFHYLERIYFAYTESVPELDPVQDSEYDEF